MPILVKCPKCQAQFNVSDKFAGKQGPCPKCKAVIKVPELTPEVKIHAPEEFVSGGKTATGRPVLKPITRQDTRFKVLPTVGLVLGTGALVFAAWILGPQLRSMLWLRVLALFAASAPIAICGYFVLRNDELEPYRRRALWMRALLCSLAYVALWGGYYLYYILVPDMLAQPMSWILLAPPLLALGAGAALVSLDLEFGSAFFHYCFYVVVMFALGLSAGLHMPWQPIPSSEIVGSKAPPDKFKQPSAVNPSSGKAFDETKFGTLGPQTELPPEAPPENLPATGLPTNAPVTNPPETRP